MKKLWVAVDPRKHVNVFIIIIERSVHKTEGRGGANDGGLHQGCLRVAAL
jgi:hypothetical protein